MHAEAAEWLERYGNTDPVAVLEIGSLNINGSARVHWPNACWLGIDWQAIVGRVRPLLLQTGYFVGTCAGPRRTPHSAVDGGPLRLGEYYGNLTADELLQALQDAGFLRVIVHDTGADLRWWAA